MTAAEAPDAADPALAGWFAVIDTAQDSRLFSLVERAAVHVSLFAGTLEPVLAAASPWLVQFDRAPELFSTWRAHGQGRNWGILCHSELPLAEVRRHFRRFLQAKLPDGTIALFRFYDPRVFNTYIRAATVAEREPWFEAVDTYAVEASTPGVMHNYRLHADQLYDGNTLVSV